MSRTTREPLPGNAERYWLGCHVKATRDRKKWMKPAGWFKRMRRRLRRARQEQAIREGREMPRFKRDDEWAWN